MFPYCTKNTFPDHGPHARMRSLLEGVALESKHPDATQRAAISSRASLDHLSDALLQVRNDLVRRWCVHWLRNHFSGECVSLETRAKDNRTWILSKIRRREKGRACIWGGVRCSLLRMLMIRSQGKKPSSRLKCSMTSPNLNALPSLSLLHSLASFAFILRWRNRIPWWSTASKPPTIRAEQATEKLSIMTANEIKALDLLTNTGCSDTPTLYSWHQGKQNDKLWVPSGHITYILMGNFLGLR